MSDVADHPVNLDLEPATRIETFAASVISVFGSIGFIVAQTLFVSAWIALNVIGLWGLHWDPYPFILLNLAFSTQAAYAAPLILLAQNRQSAHDRAIAEHDYAVNQEALDHLRAIRGIATEVSEELDEHQN